MVRGKTASDLTAMGFDPGFTKAGIVVLKQIKRGPPGFGTEIRLLHHKFVKTEKAQGKERRDVRVTNDDMRRYFEVLAELSRSFSSHNPTALGIEAYTVNPKQQGSIAGVKTFGVYTGAMFWARTVGMFVAPYRPSDLKRRFCGQQSASKQDVEDALRDEVVGLAEALDDIPKGQREHVADAAGCAVLAMEELDRIRKAMGL